MIAKHRRPSRNGPRLFSDASGAVAAVFAVVLTAMVGFGALGIETGLWFTERRQLQTAADAAAISGAFQLANAASLATIQAAGTAMAVNNRFVNAAPNTIVISEGNWNGAAFTSGGAPLNAVKAVLTSTKNTLFAAISLPTVTIGVQAVAIVNTSFGHPCVLALDNGTSTKTNPGIGIAGSSSLNVGNCMIASNAKGPFSIQDQGGAGNNVTAGDLYTVGSVNFTGSPNFTPAPGMVPISGAAPVPDPFSSLPISPGGGNQTVGAKTTLSPGIYNGGMSLTGGGPYTLQPGTYYMVNGDFTIKNASVTGSGVTIVLTGSPASKIGGVQIGPNATGSLTEPTSGTYSGILFYQDRNSTGGNSNNCKSPANSINANAGISLGGTLYMPSEPLCFQGGPTTIANGCLQLVAWQISIQGNPTISDTGCPSGVTGFGITNVILAQ